MRRNLTRRSRLGLGVVTALVAALVSVASPAGPAAAAAAHAGPTPIRSLQARAAAVVLDVQRDTEAIQLTAATYRQDVVITAGDEARLRATSRRVTTTSRLVAATRIRLQQAAISA